MQRYRIDPDRSTVVVEARSSVGPIAWEATGLTGDFAVAVIEGQVDVSPPPTGWVELRLDEFTSGNRVYDAELRRRIDAERHPVGRAVLDTVTRDDDGIYRARGRLDLHGVERPISGDLRVDVRGDRVLVTAEHQLDIRDYGLPAPTMMMLKVYPDVRVHLVIVGVPAAGTPGSTTGA